MKIQELLTLYGGTGSKQLDTLYETMQETLNTLKIQVLQKKSLLTVKNN